MSSILKALKKLEAEKALQQEHKGINVSQDILKEKTADRRIIFWFSLAGIVAVAIIATLSVMLFSKTPADKGAVSVPAPLIPAKETALPPAAGIIISPPVVNSGSVTATPPVTAPEKPGQLQDKPQDKPQAQPAPQPAAGRVIITEMPDSNTAVNTPRPEPVRKPLPVREPEQADNSLTLSGIAWNKDSADRLAIINGRPTAIGATVGGAVVEEIMPDRVKVSRDGRSFDIYLGKTATAN